MMEKSYSYMKFEQLLEERDIKTATVAKETGIAKATFSDWKHGRSKPKMGKLQKIAKFFGVKMDYFIDYGGNF